MRTLSLIQDDERTDLPIVHYSYESRSRDNSWVWDKRRYVPWTPVVDPPEQTPAASIALIRLLNQCAEIKRADADREITIEPCRSGEAFDEAGPDYRPPQWGTGEA